MEFNLLSLNTHLFAKSNGGFWSGGKVNYEDEKRFNAIMERCRGQYDIVGLTEVWADKTRDRVKEKLAPMATFSPDAVYPIPFVTTFSGTPGMTLSVNGTFSPKAPQFAHFKNMVLEDKLAFKGVTSALVQIKGQAVGLVQTHAQASYTGKEELCRKARQRQLDETLFKAIIKLQEVIRKKEISAPIILMGDLNIVGGSDEYVEFTEKLARLGFKDCWNEVAPNDPGYTFVPADNWLARHWDPTLTAPERLDYVYLNANGSNCRCVKMDVHTDWKLELKKETLDLSDHYGISASFIV